MDVTCVRSLQEVRPAGHRRHLRQLLPPGLDGDDRHRRQPLHDKQVYRGKLNSLHFQLVSLQRSNNPATLIYLILSDLVIPQFGPQDPSHPLLRDWWPTDRDRSSDRGLPNCDIGPSVCW